MSDSWESRTQSAEDPGPLEHDTLDHKAYDRIRSMIVERRLQPGQRLQLEDLARELQVSRTPLVNALKRLAQEQFVVWVSRRGFYVRQYTKRELAQLYQVREGLEGFAGRLAALRVTDEEVKRLSTLFSGIAMPPTPETARRYLEADRAFHWRLVELSGNDQLVRTIRSVNLLIFSYQRGLVRPIEETLAEHLAITDVLRRRDADACERLLRHHFHQSYECLAREAEAEEAAQSYTLAGPLIPPRMQQSPRTERVMVF